MKESNTTHHRSKRTFWKYFPLIFMWPLLVLWSCDGSTDMSGAVDNLDGAAPPPVSNLEGPALSEPAPAPFLPQIGPDQPSSELDKIKAQSSLNQQGLPEEGQYLSSLITTPGAATLSSPSGTVNSAAPQFQWQAVSGATWYYVWVRDSGTMNYSGSPRIGHWITASAAGCGSGTGTCSWWADKNLQSGNAKWWIRTWNSAGYGPWSSAMDFMVSGVSLPATVTLVSPNSDVSTTTPELTWNSASGATWYYVWVRDSGTMNFSGEPRVKQWLSASQAGCSGGGTCSWTVNKDLMEGSTRFWVQSWNPSGFGGWSSGMHFSVNGSSPPPAATLVSPNSEVNDARPVFTWNAVSEATWYYVWVRDSNTQSGSPRIANWVTPNTAGCGSGTGTCSWQADKDLAEGNATWWINTWNEAVGSGNLGPWSSGMSFTYQSACGTSLTFTYSGAEVTYGTVIGANDRCWLDRNLGASRVATSSTDSEAYGDLFQWGRSVDGHQIRTSGTTTSLSSSDQPTHGNFILAPQSPNDWRSPQNDNLWQGVDGINNPCPSGYRLPTEAEWNAERQSWGSTNAAGAFASPLKLPVAGSRVYSSGQLSVNTIGIYWSSSTNGPFAVWFSFDSSDSRMGNFYRASGYTVRCIKDLI